MNGGLRVHVILFVELTTFLVKVPAADSSTDIDI